MLGLQALWPWLHFNLLRFGFCLYYSHCHVTFAMGPLKRRAESTTERKTDTQTFYHVSEDILYSQPYIL